MKSLSLLDSAGWATGDSSSIGDSASNLAKNVAFMYAAIRERQDQIVQTPFKWTLNGEEIDDAPFGLNAYRLARIEKALVLFNNAYFEKVYGSGSARLGGSRQRAVSLSWLNPATMKPDDSGTVLLSQGYKRYQRTTIDKKTSQENQMHIDTEHLLRFELEDMDELYSTASAARAVRSSAAVIRAIQSLQDLQFDKNNGLPVFLVIIPDRHAAKSEKIAGRFKKLFNNFSAMWGGNNRTVGVPEGVSVEKLSLSPGEMKFTESNREAAETILFGLGVPMSKAFGSANYATKKGENQEFALKMAHRLKWIADVINVDEVFKSQGYRLEVDPDKVNVNLEEEQRKADMVISYTAAGMTLSNALKVVGVRLPDDYEKQDIQVEVESQPLETSDEIGDMKQQIFGYHIETGVVRRNEVRARLGLPAIEGREESYADLISAFEVMQAARTAGLTVDESLQFVDLPEFKRGEPLQVDRRVNEVEGLTDPLEEEIKALRNFNRKGKRNREFKSNILTDEEIKLYSGMVYP
ncbi:MAG: phage portal protein [Chloroflexota bacterium]